LLDYAGKCKYLHGHNGTAVISLEGESLDHLGMVVDFSKLKQTLGKWIDDHLDHRMILHRDDPALEYLRAQGEPIYVMDLNPTAENIAKLIFDQARFFGFPVVEVKLWETASCYAVYKD
jgi:6-pyruvoyltetrahydropterin/6-carboxytetrahydropterin synthase